MTGRGAGFCAGCGVPGFANRAPGWGGGFGRGGGRGYRNRYWATGLTGWQHAAGFVPGAYAPVRFAPYQPTSEQELAALKGQVKYMEESMKEARERIAELEPENKKEKP